MIEKVADIICKSKRGVVLTGAGVSAESGVPTFRGSEGLWGKFKAEELATMDAFLTNPKIVWEWYNWRREIIGKVKPNDGHYALAKLEQKFSDFNLITQNVDNLHRIAGSQKMLELHGNIMRNKCVACESVLEDQVDINPDNILKCEKCGGSIRPDVVWFGELLDHNTIEEAFNVSEQADYFISAGTSAIVHPAASLPNTAKRHGAILIEINPEETVLTEQADFHFNEPFAEIMPRLLEQIEIKLGTVSRVEQS